MPISFSLKTMCSPPKKKKTPAPRPQLSLRACCRINGGEFFFFSKVRLCLWITYFHELRFFLKTETKPSWNAARDWVIKIEWIWLETFQIKSLTSIDTRACKFMHIALRDLWSFVSPEKKLPLLLLLQISLHSNSCYHDPSASTK